MTQAADFLVELGTEELPPKALTTLAQAFHDQLITQINNADLSFIDSEWFATPRRLAVRVNQLQLQQNDKQVERLGPAVAAAFDGEGNPKPAAIGFAKSCGVEVSDLQRIATDKGERLAFNATVKGEAAATLLPAMVNEALSKLPIPKAMRWGESQAEFIRPPHWLLMMLGEHVVEANLLELCSSNISYGHRFHAPQAITLQAPADYEKLLYQAKVDVSFQSRKANIRQQVEAIAEQQGAVAVIDEELLEEVTALVEWPVALCGKFDEAFLSVPAEALIATMQKDQKYFHLVDKNDRLMPLFITVANIESIHQESVIHGNERVIRPRLADAKFFYDADCKHNLADSIEKLKSIVFQNKLGSLYDKTQRIKTVARWIAEQIGSRQSDVERAADLCKCDLVSNMVYEFPELQGIMGRYYAANDGENPEVCAAMDDIYRPRFAGDQLPESQTGIALAIADRIDTLVGIFGIGQPPTGAKDPFALRRAALGILRILVEKELALDLKQLLSISINSFSGISLIEDTQQQIEHFFDARLQAWYQEQGFTPQVITAVTTLGLTEPLDIHLRIHAVNQFNQLESSEALAAANKRVGNILSKSATHSLKAVDENLLQQQEEIELYRQLSAMTEKVQQWVANKDYSAALNQLAGLREVIDAFFAQVMVNVEDDAIKNNRLALLHQIRSLFLSIADVSLLQK
jgi:glycyl-tRNA synthetase beta chain